LVHNGTKRKNVNFRVNLFHILNKLGALEPSDASDDSWLLFERLSHQNFSVVINFDTAILVNKYVISLKVPVHDTVVAKIFDWVNHLLEIVDDGRSVER